MYIREKKKLAEIAGIFGCSSATVGYNLDRLGIRRRTKKEIHELFRIKDSSLTEEKLFRLYIEENKTKRQISEMFGYSISGIERLLRKYGLRKTKKRRHRT